jgi:demethylmenaquinone methyltransferase/2-methoxy-6-polyprenyl-1,4-benzoquinol methylase
MTEPVPPPGDRFRPRAARELGGMFDDVSGRYDLLNRVMSLGQDRAWRMAMWRGVPDDAHAVLDLCTGSGTSLTGLRRPGRLVIGADVSRGMLDLAADLQGRTGWAPRLVCADAFRLPLADRSLDAITIAFGIRNLRPLAHALAELARVLRPGGTLVVLEAAAPAPGPVAPFHRFYLRHLIPLAGRLSADPSAYVYLSQSVFEFGTGPEFERALAHAGFSVTAARRFMLGATRLWTARRQPEPGQKRSSSGEFVMQNAGSGPQDGVKVPIPGPGRAGEWRAWTGAQLALSAALTGALGYGVLVFLNLGAALPLTGWQRTLTWALLVGGIVIFGSRSIALLRRLFGPAPRP